MATKTAPVQLLTLAWGLVLWADPAQAKAELTAADLDQSAALVELAMRHNPELSAVTWSIRALEQRVLRARSWPDPMLAVEVSNVPVDSWVLGDHAMSGLQFKLQQTFPFPGKRRLREEVAQGEVRQQRLLLRGAQGAAPRGGQARLLRPGPGAAAQAR